MHRIRRATHILNDLCASLLQDEALEVLVADGLEVAGQGVQGREDVGAQESALENERESRLRDGEVSRRISIQGVMMVMRISKQKRENMKNQTSS